GCARGEAGGGEVDVAAEAARRGDGHSIDGAAAADDALAARRGGEAEVGSRDAEGGRAGCGPARGGDADRAAGRTAGNGRGDLAVGVDGVARRGAVEGDAGRPGQAAAADRDGCAYRAAARRKGADGRRRRARRPDREVVDV